MASVTGQSFADIAVLVVESASREGNLDIVERLSAEHLDQRNVRRDRWTSHHHSLPSPPGLSVPDPGPGSPPGAAVCHLHYEFGV